MHDAAWYCVGATGLQGVSRVAKLVHLNLIILCPFVIAESLGIGQTKIKMRTMKIIISFDSSQSQPNQFHMLLLW